jgi:hypothetical protein
MSVVIGFPMQQVTQINLPYELFNSNCIEYHYGTGRDRFNNLLSLIKFPTCFYRVVHTAHPKWDAINILNIGHGQGKVNAFSGMIDNESIVQVGPYRAYYDGPEFVGLEYEGNSHEANRSLAKTITYLKQTDGNVLQTTLILFHQVVTHNLWDEKFTTHAN